MEKFLHTLTLGRGANPFLCNNFLVDILYFSLAGSYFICVWKVKSIRMGCFFTCFDLRQTGSFSVTDPFLTTFCYFEKRNGILRNNREEGFEKSYVPLHGVGGGVKIAKIILT